MPITTCVFDAYGTLFDVTAAARAAAAEPDFERLAQSWPDLAQHWRDKQLQYTWLRTIMGTHADFWQVTQDGLDWALEQTGHAGDAPLRQRLLDLYWALPAYAEVPQVLERLKSAGLNTAILSNGSEAMLQAAMASAGLGPRLDACLSVDAVGRFKPSADVYDLVAARFGTAPNEVLFVSSNGWDAAGAAHYGFVTAWVNRANAPEDRLPARPHHVLSDLSGIPGLAGL